MARIKAINILHLLIKQDEPNDPTIEKDGFVCYSIPSDEYWGHNNYRINQIQRVIDEDNNAVILLVYDCTELTVLDEDVLDIDVYRLVLTHPF